MDALIAKAGVLIEALPYIQRFRSESIVVKFGGSAMEERRNVHGVLEDVTFMECVGMRPVVVHGGGKAISRAMQKMGIAPRFVGGVRVTCEETIKVVKSVIADEINAELVSILRKLGARAEPVHGETVFRVARKGGVDPETGATIDWGYVGEPIGVETVAVEKLLCSDIIPVITPLGLGEDGLLHNMNADTAAAALAGALKARKLAYLSDVPGLLRDENDATSLLNTVRTGDVERLIKTGAISGGMLPKIESCLDALRAGVRKVHLIDGRMPHSLLLEIFTDKGVGTEILNDD